MILAISIVIPASPAGQRAAATPLQRISPLSRRDQGATLRASIRSGKLDRGVVTQLRRRGSVDALLIVRDSDVLADSIRSAPSGLGQATGLTRIARPIYRHRKGAVLGRHLGVELLRDYPELPMMFVRIASRAALIRVVNDPQVVGIGRNTLFREQLAESLPLIRQPQAAAAGDTGAGTSVVVLDTGVDYTRSAFGSCSAPGVPAGCKIVYAQDFAPDDGSLDDDGHGTNVAGIVVGVAPSAGVLALDVFNGATASSSDVIAAINFAIANRSTYNIRAMNLSLGDLGHNASQCSGGSNPYVAAFANARAAGIMPVVAAGNNAIVNGNYVDGLSNPACTPGAMSVGAVYDSNVGGLAWGSAPFACSDPTTQADQITCFSQAASYLSVLAPGALITAAGLTQGGTSQAAPHVAGAVAVLAGASPGSALGPISTAISNSGPTLFDPLSNTTKHRFDLPDAVTVIGPATGADVSISNVDGPDPLQVGGTITYTITVTNNGPEVATGLSVTDTLPASVTLSSAPGCTGTTSLTCSVPDLAAGESASLQIVVTTTVAGTVTNTASVSSSSADPTSSNNSATATTTVGVLCTVSGTAGDDLLEGTPGNDVICGEAGSDYIIPGGGDDSIIGGPGFDYVSYEDASSGVQVDLSSGTATGGSGNDTLQTIEAAVGSPFADMLRGSAGRNELIGLGGSDDVDGEGGFDYVRFDLAHSSIVVNLRSGVAKGEGRDSLSGIEGVVGSDRSDRVTGNNKVNWLYGGKGNDRLSGGGGNDVVFGGPGNDRLSGGNGNDRLNGGPGRDTCDQGSGHGSESSC